MRIQNQATRLELIGVSGAIAFAVFVTLPIAIWIQCGLGTMGMEIATRLLGLVLAALGVQFMLNGLANATIGLMNLEVAR